MKTVIVIPARLASSRLPQKPLADINGKPMIQWVYENAAKVRGVEKPIVATDDERIMNVVEGFGGQAVMTSSEIASGTDRVAAVADRVTADIYVNMQGDEPLLKSNCIEVAIELVRTGKFPMGTLMTPMKSIEDLQNQAVVKVLTDQNGRAIYFSRHPIPYSRGSLPGLGESFVCRRHLGIYVYKRETLFRIRSLPASRIEKAEVLEQLRAVEDGISIGIAQVDTNSFGIDTPEDLDQVRRLLV